MMMLEPTNTFAVLFVVCWFDVLCQVQWPKREWKLLHFVQNLYNIDYRNENIAPILTFKSVISNNIDNAFEIQFIEKLNGSIGKLYNYYLHHDSEYEKKVTAAKKRKEKQDCYFNSEFINY